MNPIEFKNIWKLTPVELAVVLGYKSDRTVRRWESTNTDPLSPACVACHLLNEKWNIEGKKIIVGLHLFQHPMEFKKRWDLTYAELALALDYESDRTVRSWGLTGDLHREPQPPAYVACFLLNEKWEKEGKSTELYFWKQNIA